MKQNINISNGNATGFDHNGWFMGHFMEKELGMLHTQDFEMKWGVQARGEGRDTWSSDHRQTISILISGRMDVIFRDRTVTLKNPGDFVMWKDEDHKSDIPEDSVILTVRWPSV